MYSVVRVHEDLHEGLLVCLVDLTEPLAHQTKELLVSSLLGTAVNDHVTQLKLLTCKTPKQIIKSVQCLIFSVAKAFLELQMSIH